MVVNDLGVAISDTDGAGTVPAANPGVAVVAEIEAAGGRAVLSTDSVATAAGGAAIVQAALDSFGRVDVVINNAGVVRQAPFAEYDPGLLDDELSSQIGGHFNVTRAAWPVMTAAGYGRVVNLSSGAGLWGVPGMTGYAAAKLGIVGFTRALALEGAEHGITVNVVAPCAKTRPGGFGPIPGVTGPARLALDGRGRAPRGVARPRGLRGQRRVLQCRRRVHRARDRRRERRLAGPGAHHRIGPRPLVERDGGWSVDTVAGRAR